MIDYQSITIGYNSYMQWQYIDISGKQALCHEQIVQVFSFPPDRIEAKGIQPEVSHVTIEGLRFTGSPDYRKLNAYFFIFLFFCKIRNSLNLEKGHFTFKKVIYIFFRYSCGVIPVNFLKKRLKLDGSENPNS